VHHIVHHLVHHLVLHLGPHLVEAQESVEQGAISFIILETWQEAATVHCLVCAAVGRKAAAPPTPVHPGRADQDANDINPIKLLYCHSRTSETPGRTRRRQAPPPTRSSRRSALGTTARPPPPPRRCRPPLVFRPAGLANVSVPVQEGGEGGVPPQLAEVLDVPGLGAPTPRPPAGL
jgi:hypothetical protein